MRWATMDERITGHILRGVPSACRWSSSRSHVVHQNWNNGHEISKDESVHLSVNSSTPANVWPAAALVSTLADNLLYEYHKWNELWP